MNNLTLTKEESDFLSDWLAEDLLQQKKEQTITDEANKTLKSIVTKLFKIGLTKENKDFETKTNLLNCVVDLENYFIDFLDNLTFYQHSQGESEDDVKGNIANILENHNCYDLVRGESK